MVEAVKRFAQLDVELTPEERNLFAVAYKTVISQRRASWRLLLDLEEKEHGSKGASQKLAILQDVRNMLEKEMSQIAHEVLSLVEKHLLPNSTSEEALIFFQKMYGNDTDNRGDYYRYCSETAMGQQRREAAQTALLAYKAAYDGAVMHLHPTHPLRLGLALNFSVFYYEILGANERACKLAKQAFDDAMAELQLLGEHPFQESTAILQLIRDNLTVWNAAPESGAVRTLACWAWETVGRCACKGVPISCERPRPAWFCLACLACSDRCRWSRDSVCSGGRHRLEQCPPACTGTACQRQRRQRRPG